MLTAGRTLTLNVDKGRPLPRVPELEALYAGGTVPRYGQIMMLAGRSGSQKSGFALWYADRLGLPTLYFSADMDAATASMRIASSRTGMTEEEIRPILDAGGPEAEDIIAEANKSKITFAFGQPITLANIDKQLDAVVELMDEYPALLVFDNLMDFDGAESDYGAQMEIMQRLTELNRDTEAAILLLHHASDKSWDARTEPFKPPSRDQVKGGMSEKPELSLTVALDPTTNAYHIATVKSRFSKCDPTAREFITLRCQPELTRFHKWGALI